MGLNAGKILKISITTDSKEEVLEYIRKYLFRNEIRKTKNEKLRIKPLVIVTPNPEQIVYAQRDDHFRNILNEADVALPDGIGISLAAKFLNVQIPNSNDQKRLRRIPGVEFMEDLVALAAKEHVRIGLIGGRSGLAVHALECLQARYFGLTGWADDGPDLNIGDPQDLGDIGYIKRIADEIHSTKPQLVFVGMGAPKQEYFIDTLRSQISDLRSPIILMSVGGSFDIITGRLKRAPLIIRSIGFEWFWRLVQEPWRLRRQLALIKFVQLVYVEFSKNRSRGSVSRSEI